MGEADETVWKGWNVEVQVETKKGCCHLFESGELSHVAIPPREGFGGSFIDKNYYHKDTFQLAAEPVLKGELWGRI